MRYAFIYKFVVVCLIVTAATSCNNTHQKTTQLNLNDIQATGKFGKPFNVRIFYSVESIIERLQTENKSFALPLNISGKKGVVHGIAHYSYHSDSKAKHQITATGIQIQ